MHSITLLLLLVAGPATVPEPATPGKGWFKPAEVERGCVARGIVMPPGLSGSGRVTAKFAVQEDGSADRVEVPEVVPRPIAEAIATAVKGCRFTPGRKPDGKRAVTWATLPLRFVEEAPASSPATGVAPPVPGSPPREAEPGCIQRQLHYRLPPNRLLHGPVVVRVATTPEGKKGEFQLPPELPDDAAKAFRLSIEDCPLLPAATPEGTPIAGTFEYRINFAQPGEAERAAAAPGLMREAKLASTACLQRLRPSGVTGHAVVQVLVTAEGEPTHFRFEPQNIPVDLRTQIADVLSMCKWETALGLDGKPVAGETVVTIRYR
jgi:hypothetical protein